ncbi:MAG: putative molybdenum carrier protein [Pirellulaceae bacterium]
MNQNHSTGGAELANRTPPLIVGTLVRKIISGGQTGVDRGALVAAIELGIEHGGYCPRGRLAEDGPIDGRFQLTPTDSAAYHIRTEKNVDQSSGTLIVYRGLLVGGTALTEKFALRHQRPCLNIDMNQPQPPVRVEVIRGWLRKHRIEVLNIAGPRESSQPGIQEETRQLVHDIATGAFTIRRQQGSLESVASQPALHRP